MLGPELGDATRVLVVSERPTRLRSLVEALEKQSPHPIKTYALSEPWRLMQAATQLNPDVIVTDAWYERSRSNFWRYMKPVKDVRPGTRIVILENEGGHDSRSGNRPARVLRFGDKTVIPRQRAADEGVLAGEVARSGRHSGQRISGRMRRACALMAG